MRRFIPKFARKRKITLSSLRKIEDTHKRNNFLINLKRTSLVSIAAVLMFTAVQPSSVMAIFNLLNPAEITTRAVKPLESDEYDFDTLDKISQFDPVPASDTTESKDIRNVNRTKVSEVTSKRDAYSKTYRNSDGTNTVEFSTEQLNYLDGETWKPIDNKVYKKDGKNDVLSTKAGKISGTFASLNEGITINAEGKTITMKPIGTTDSKPEMLDDHTIIYRNAWDGVDIQYQMRGEAIKETIIINDADTRSTFDFEITGAKLTEHPSIKGALAIEGLPKEYSISPIVIDVNERGVISEQRASQIPTDSGMRITVDEAWLKNLPKNAFPVKIDPSWTYDQGPTSYKMYKSDGYYCDGTVCYANTGSINDGSWKSWRTYLNFSYQDKLQNTKVLNADFHGDYQSGAGGTTTNYTITAGEASCSNAFGCFGTTIASDTSVTSDFDIDFTSKLRALVDADDYSTWWSFKGVEGSATTFKPYYKIVATVTYDTPTPATTLTSPSDKAVITHTQPSLKANSVTDADGEKSQYYFRVATGTNAESGAVINSGWIDANQWTVPDNILQDGTTYYWHVYTRGDANKQTTQPSGSPRSFKIDLRTGKDSTQAYDNLGPINVDLATGNVTTAVASHNMSALGGLIGLNLDYNTPTMTRSGLQAEYWDANSFSGSPTITRVDSDVNFDWGSGSPDTAIAADTFAGRWTGYITIDETADYQFGCTVDDNCNVWVNNALVATKTGPGTAYGSAMNLTEGTTLPIKMEMTENTGGAQAKLKYKRNGGADTVVPESWLNTAPRPVTNDYGLVGHYYNDPSGTYAFPTNAEDPNRLLMVRQDRKLNFNWQSSSPTPGLPTDRFLARWTGYLTVPETKSYQIGIKADDRLRAKFDDGASGWNLVNSWTSSTTEIERSSSVSLTANQARPITIEYAEQTGNANFVLYIKDVSANLEYEIPVEWLTPSANILPEGWEMSIGSGAVRFERLQVKSDSVVASDSSRQKYEFKYNTTKKSYESAKGTEAVLIRNDNNTYNISDVDGSTYLFDAAGKLKSWVGPQDDRQPAALEYEYGGTPSRLTKIKDGVDPSRFGTLYYAGASQCVTGSGFTAAPAGMLCAFITTDSDASYFQYDNQGRLARVVTPGDAYEDFRYDSKGRLDEYRDILANDAIAYGVRSNNDEAKTLLTYDVLGRLTSITSPAPTPGADRIEHNVDYLHENSDMHITGASEPNGFSKRVEYDANFRTIAITGADNLSSTTQWDSSSPEETKDLVYSTTDALGLKTTYIYNENDMLTDTYGPAPSAWYGGNRLPLPTYTNQIPHTKTNYDEGIQGLNVSYMDIKQRTKSVLAPGQTMHKGDYLKSTDDRFKFIYQTDGNVVLYNSSGTAVWNNGKAGVASDRLVMQGDGNLVLYNGSSAVWHTYSGGNGSSKLVLQNDGNAVVYLSDNTAYTWNSDTNVGESGSGYTSLIGTPLLSTLNIGSDVNKLSNTWSSSPVPSNSNYWGMRMSGKVVLPTTGNWKFKIVSDNGARLFVDGNLGIDDWEDTNISKTHPTYTFNNTTANKPLNILIDYYHLGGTSANFTLYMTPPGGSETSNVRQYFKPNYGLVTSTVAYDSILGDTTTATEYSDPTYGLVSQTSIDPTGLNLENQASYESPGSGYLRQTSRTTPGGSQYTYQYYGATQSVDNPCTVTSDGVSQAGRAKGKTEPDPDGSGSQTSRTTETVYNASGDVVATRFNNDPWTCITYDDRGRQVESVQPTVNGRAGRTVTNYYVVDNDPLKDRTVDSVAGTTERTVDLLGRVMSSEDVWGNAYTATYDDFGNITEKSGPLGTEEFTYDSLYRLTNYTLDSTILATITYDTYSRVDTVTYPQAKDSSNNPLQLTQIKRDSLQRSNGVSYETSDGEIYDEDLVLSQLGKVVGVTQEYDGQTLDSDFTYDGAGRLTSATVGETQFGYGYGAPDSATCSANSANNTNSHKNSNRTSYTVTNATTSTVVTNDKLCYDKADKLTYSTDANIGTPTYDDHGNTVSFAGSGTALEFEYDASDYNIAVEQGNKRTQYIKTSDGAILRKKEFTDSSLTTSYRYVAGGSILQTCSLTDDNDCTSVDKYLSLPGNVTLTLSPSNSDPDKQTVYSLKSYHGDTVLTLTGEGKVSSSNNTLLGYGAFGEPLIAGTLGATTDNALNSTDSTQGWAANPTRKQDTRYTTTFIQMGARVYVPSLGRFLQVDPEEGGTENPYSYVTDPVNYNDYDGRFVWFIPLIIAIVRIVITVAPVVIRAVTAIVAVTKVAKTVATTAKVTNYTNKSANAAQSATTATRGGNAATSTTKATSTATKSGNTASQATKSTRDNNAKPVRILQNNNILRVGNGRVSIGPAPAFYRDLSPVGKLLSPLHIHIERTKVWVDINWIGKGFKAWPLW